MTVVKRYDVYVENYKIASELHLDVALCLIKGYLESYPVASLTLKNSCDDFDRPIISKEAIVASYDGGFA